MIDVNPMLNVNDNTSHSIQLSKERNFNNLRRAYPGRKKEAIMARIKVKTEVALIAVKTKSITDTATKK